MEKKRNIELVWSISLLILGIASMFLGIISVAGVEIPHTIRVVIAAVQIIAGIAVIITTVLKLKMGKEK